MFCYREKALIVDNRTTSTSKTSYRFVIVMSVCTGRFARIDNRSSPNSSRIRRHVLCVLPSDIPQHPSRRTRSLRTYIVLLLLLLLLCVIHLFLFYKKKNTTKYYSRTVNIMYANASRIIKSTFIYISIDIIDDFNECIRPRSRTVTKYLNSYYYIRHAVLLVIAVSV